MKIFIYEHLTSGALAGQRISDSLLHEGEAMVKAISNDLAALGYQVTLLRDSRLPDLSDASGKIVSVQVDSPAVYQRLWQQSLQQFEHFMVIAPETGGTLAQLVTQLERRGKHHLGCSAEAIRDCSDKLLCSQRLRSQQILTPVTMLAADWLSQYDKIEEQDWIIKPRDGAGCEQTFRMNAAEAGDYLFSLNRALRRQMIVQPYINGEALSLNLFFNHNGVELLSVNRQHIQQQGQQLRLEHCETGQQDRVDADQLQRLILQIQATMPGLWGYVGVDLIQTAEALWLIEINPRLTASYAEPGFRQHANPARYLQHALSQMSA